jgi:hypothetical protein
MGDLRHVETSHEQFIKIPFHTDGLHDLLLPGDVAADQSTELGASADAEKKIGVNGSPMVTMLGEECYPLVN